MLMSEGHVQGLLYLIGVLCYVSLLSQRVHAQNELNAIKGQNKFDLRKVSINNNEVFHEDDYDTLSFEHGDIIIVGIAGGSGSGKTTLAQAIYDAVGGDNITYISHDSYYKDISHMSLNDRAKHNFDHPHSLETELLIEHLKQLKQGHNVSSIHSTIVSYVFTLVSVYLLLLIYTYTY